MNPIQNIRNLIESIVTDAVIKCSQQGNFSYQDMPEFLIEVPNDIKHGDFACNIAMLLAKQARMAPRQIADYIVNAVDRENTEIIEKIEVAGAGFINFYLNNAWLFQIPKLICQLGEEYGQNDKQNIKVQVEFVSANPTGNLHMGNARGGAIGDTMANILSLAGYDVEREYYINDAGNQIEIFALSLEARYLQLLGQKISFPENGYAGQDVVDTVKKIIQEFGEKFVDMPSEKRRQELVAYALQEKMTYIKNTLDNFGINYDVWFNEKTLHENGSINAVIEELKEKGYIYESEGALWLKSTAFGEEKDEVIIRANGLPTYFAADIAYHKNKFERGFNWVINVWGADHHGHVARMKRAMEALGYNPDNLDILLIQLVRLYRGGQIVRMSKRTGTTVSLDELIEEVGKDAARFFFVMRSPDSHLDFDMELARKKTQDNPVYYVQYAHARIMSIFRQAKAAGIKLKDINEIDFSILGKDELKLIRKAADFPEEIMVAARTLAPHRIARYVMELAGDFHSFYNHNRVIIDNEALRDARLGLMQIVRTTIKNALDVLGVSAPEQM